MEKQPIPDFLPESLPEGGPVENPTLSPEAEAGLRAAGCPEEIIARIKRKDPSVTCEQLPLDRGLPSDPKIRPLAIQAIHTAMIEHLHKHGIDVRKEIEAGRRDMQQLGHQIISTFGGMLGGMMGGVYSRCLEVCDGDVERASLLADSLFQTLSEVIHMEQGARREEYFAAIILKRARSGNNKDLFGPDGMKNLVKGIVSGNGGGVPRDVAEAFKKLL